MSKHPTDDIPWLEHPAAFRTRQIESDDWFYSDDSTRAPIYEVRERLYNIAQIRHLLIKAYDMGLEDAADQVAGTYDEKQRRYPEREIRSMKS